MHVLNILWVVFGIGLMLVLNLRFKINSMVALLLAGTLGRYAGGNGFNGATAHHEIRFWQHAG